MSGRNGMATGGKRSLNSSWTNEFISRPRPVGFDSYFISNPDYIAARISTPDRRPFRQRSACDIRRISSGVARRSNLRVNIKTGIRPACRWQAGGCLKL
jgi:hypothetical protein